jgi:NitT/TauT family transport system ATP-binding protein
MGGSGEPLIEIRDLGMTYQTARGASLRALDSVALDVSRGEFVSLIGPSGCGKSTMLQMLGGLRPIREGRVVIGGRPVTGPRPDEVAFVFQDYTLYPWRTILGNVEIGLQFRGVAKGDRRRAALRYLELVGLEAFGGAYPKELSGGMQQRVAIARALAMEPGILLMDEPFGSLDEQTRIVLGRELARIVETTQKTTVFVTHSLSEAIYLSDRVVVLTARPGRLKKILEVPEPRPRQAAFMTSQLFGTLRAELFSLLLSEVEARVREESGGPIR